MPDKDKSAGVEVAGRSIKWDDSNMQTSYANVVNASGTREEIVLLFGTNQTWHAGQKDVSVLLHNRIVLSPYAAKRLALLLGATVKKYEETFGEVVISKLPEAGNA